MTAHPEREARHFARKIIALDTEMERRSANPDDPGDAESWSNRWTEMVEEARALLAVGDSGGPREGPGIPAMMEVYGIGDGDLYAKVERVRREAEAATWEQAAKFVEDKADEYGEKAVPASARPVAAATLRQVGKALRVCAAAPEAERPEPGP